MASESRPFVYFGSSKVAILKHQIHNFNQITSHRATISVLNGQIERMYLANEVLDLVSKKMGFDPIKNHVLGSRVVTDKAAGEYGLYWATVKEVQL